MRASYSQYFFAGWILAASGMVMLLALYIFLTLVVANATMGHIDDNTFLLDQYPLLLGLLLYIIPFVIGILLFAALLKPLLARSSAKKMSLLVTQKKEPALYAFLEKICHAAGAETPSSIAVDCSVIATAHYRRGIISFLEDDLSMTIGLPLLSEMSLSELASLLLHEVGQYRQKTEIRLSYVISRVNRWFTRVVYERDVIDERLTLIEQTSGGVASQIPLSIAKFFIWLSRKILTVFMLAGFLISKIYVRYIEFEADECSVSLNGYEPLKSALTKMQLLRRASQEAFSRLKTQRDPNDNSLPDDFILLISSMSRQSPDQETEKKKKVITEKQGEIRSVSPTDQERLESVKNIASKNLFQSDKPASSLFTNFEELTKIASLQLYRDVLGLHFSKEDIVPTNQFEGSAIPSHETSGIDSNFF